MEKNVGIVELVRGVIQSKVAGPPARSRHNRVICRYCLRVVSVEISDENLAGWTGIRFEGDFALGDRFAAKRLDKIVGESMGLAAQRSAGVTLGTKIALVEPIGAPA